MPNAGQIRLILGRSAYEARWRVEAGTLHLASEHGDLASAADEAPEEQAARLLTVLVRQARS